MNWLKAKLDRAEQNGFTEDSKEMIRKQSKAKLNGNI